MPLRLCIVFIFISSGSFAQDFYIELEREVTPIWQAQYPLNICGMEIQSYGVTQPGFLYDYIEAPFILPEEIPFPENNGNRWGTGVIYDKEQTLGLIGYWGSSQSPLNIKNIISHGEANTGIYSSLNWVSGDRISMSHSMIYNDSWSIKNNWKLADSRKSFSIQDNIYGNGSGQTNGFLFLDFAISVQTLDFGIEGALDTLQNTKDLLFLFAYNTNPNMKTGLKLGYSFSGKKHINGAIFINYSGDWEVDFSTGYIRTILPSVLFDETSIAMNHSDIFLEPQFFTSIEIKKSFSDLYFESSFLWKSIPGMDFKNQIGGSASLTLPEETFLNLPIGITSVFAYNDDLVQPENLSAVSGLSGTLTMYFPLGDSLDFSSNITINQDGFKKTSFMILWGGVYVGNV